jgi:hypothetical protein
MPYGHGARGCRRKRYAGCDHCRFFEQDREDIAALARRRLIDAKCVESRPSEALGGYVGDTTRFRGIIVGASRMVAANRPKRRPDSGE